MASQFQTSSPIQAASLPDDILTYGNSTLPTVSTVTSVGSKSSCSEVTVLGTQSSILNSRVLAIKTSETETTTNWTMDIYVRAFSDSSVSIIHSTVMKPTSSTSDWALFYGQSSTTSAQKLLPPNLIVDQANYSVILQQPASLQDDGLVYYVVRFEYASGNNQNSALPVFVN